YGTNNKNSNKPSFMIFKHIFYILYILFKRNRCLVGVVLFLIKNITIKTEIRQNKGIEKKGKNQITAVKAAPKIGLNTLPAVFAVSIIPSVALATDSL